MPKITPADPAEYARRTAAWHKEVEERNARQTEERRTRTIRRERVRKVKQRHDLERSQFYIKQREELFAFKERQHQELFEAENSLVLPGDAE
ncbi:MAG TPA: hypothetical protein VJP80_01025 [Candidatus Saccharimonadales bacterium]|nr:hypothetical protein [Candidatus Saccharimonadales bacterium]